MQNHTAHDLSYMFEAARSFIGGAKIIIESDGIVDDGNQKHPTLPVIVCSAIAIEIQLKALLQVDSKKRPSGDGHDLKNLFESLRPERQTEILENQILYTGFDSRRARQQLYIEKDVFKKWRYPYESADIETAPAFLLGFALSLSDFIKSNYLVERSDNGWLKREYSKTD